MILKSESYKKGVVFSTGANLFAKGLAFIQQLLIALYFGAQVETDIFFFVYNIILFSTGFFTNFTNSVLIPELMKLRVQVSERESIGFMNLFVWGYLFFGLLIFLLFLIDTTGAFRLISSFSYSQISSSICVIRWCLPIFILSFVTNVMSDILVSYKYFTIPMIANIINCAFGVFFILFFHDSLGLSSIAIGLILGYIINLIMLIFILRSKIQWDFLCIRRGNLKNIGVNGLYSQVGYAIYLFALYMPQYIFSGFSVGTLSAINYTQKIIDIPAVFFSTQIVNVAGVKFNELMANKNRKALYELFANLFIVVVVVLFIVMFLFLIFTKQIVFLLFGQSKFEMSTYTLIVDLLKVFLLYPPYAFMFALLTRFLYSLQNLKIGFVIQIIVQGLSVAILLLLVNTHGALAYPLSRLISYLLVINLFFYLIWRKYPDFKLKTIVSFVNIINIVILTYVVMM